MIDDTQVRDRLRHAAEWISVDPESNLEALKSQRDARRRRERFTALAVAAVIALAAVGVPATLLTRHHAAPAAGGILAKVHGWIAYSETTVAGAEVVALDPASPSSRIQLTSGPGINLPLSWSADGSRLLFERRSPRFAWLYVLDANGRTQQLHLGGVRVQATASLSPDGSTVMFSGIRPGASRVGLYSFDIANGEVTAIASPTGGELGSPVWSPDGHRIAYASYGSAPGIWLAGPDGSNQREIVRFPLNSAEAANGIAWSPDGTQLAFGAGSAGDRTSDIYVVGADGSSPKKLTDHGWNARPSWSPDGSRIAYVRIAYTRGIARLATMARDGTDVQGLDPGEWGLNLSSAPAWNPLALTATAPGTTGTSATTPLSSAADLGLCPPGTSGSMARLSTTGGSTDVTPIFGTSRVDLRAVAANDAGFVAVGDTSGGGGTDPVWFSADGRTWSRAPKAGGPDSVNLWDVVSGGPGFLAAGVGRPVGPAIWYSADGRSWTKADLALPHEPDRAGDVTGIVPTGAGYLAWGHVRNADGYVWTSKDGRTWRPIAGESVFGGPGEQSILCIGRGPDEFVAFGSERPAGSLKPGDPVAWTSPDGANWNRVSNPTDAVLTQLKASTSIPDPTTATSGIGSVTIGSTDIEFSAAG